jgi:hypothetical protein
VSLATAELGGEIVKIAEVSTLIPESRRITPPPSSRRLEDTLVDLSGLLACTYDLDHVAERRDDEHLDGLGKDRPADDDAWLQFIRVHLAPLVDPIVQRSRLPPSSRTLSASMSIQSTSCSIGNIFVSRGCNLQLECDVAKVFNAGERDGIARNVCQSRRPKKRTAAVLRWQEKRRKSARRLDLIAWWMISGGKR